MAGKGKTLLRLPSLSPAWARFSLQFSANKFLGAWNRLATHLTPFERPEVDKQVHKTKSTVKTKFFSDIHCFDFWLDFIS